MAAIANLRVEQGATFSSDVTVKDSDGNAFDLTGYSASGSLAKGYSSSFYDRTSFTCTIATPSTGVITLDLTADQTNALEEGRYVYDVEILRASDSTITRVIEGIVTVSPSVTV
tara:strand:- start:1293 stop:1634 length:342 start_codon:yes stop_codon:yes gene_type:complete